MKSLIRKVALIVLIVADLLMLSAFLYFGMWMWFWPFLAINLVIIAGEIVSVIKTGKTMSTQYKYWIERNPVFAYFALIMMAVAFAALIVHLGVV